MHVNLTSWAPATRGGICMVRLSVDLTACTKQAGGRADFEPAVAATLRPGNPKSALARDQWLACRARGKAEGIG